MANSTQSTTPVDFMPYLNEYLRESVALDGTDVRQATDESGATKPHNLGERLVQLILDDPNPVNPNAGAGRHGFLLTRTLKVRLWTRGGSDPAGEDEIALAAHWTFQDQVLNALLVLPHLTDTVQSDDNPLPRPFVTPVKYLGGGTVKRSKDSGAAYVSTLAFQVAYVARVTLP